MTDRERYIQARKEARRYKRKYMRLKNPWKIDSIPERKGYYLTVCVEGYNVLYFDGKFNDNVIAWMEIPEVGNEEL